jgi:hypothetical protein
MAPAVSKVPVMPRTSGLFLLVPVQVSIKGGESPLNKYIINLLKCCVSENGECAFGLLTSPFFLRIESREEANQIFVDGYMNHSVTCFV